MYKYVDIDLSQFLEIMSNRSGLNTGILSLTHNISYILDNYRSNSIYLHFSMLNVQITQLPL